jgi:hypothetical protein
MGIQRVCSAISQPSRNCRERDMHANTDLGGKQSGSQPAPVNSNPTKGHHILFVRLILKGVEWGLIKPALRCFCKRYYHLEVQRLVKGKVHPLYRH